MLDIHSHVRYEDGEYNIQEVLEDQKKFNIEKRVISSINGKDIKENNRAINQLVAENPSQLIGCAVINPKLDSAIFDVEDALSLENIQMFEFNSFEHGYYPDTEALVGPVIEKIAQANKIIKVFVGIGAHSVPQQWEKYVEKYPNTPFIFLHMGCFDYGYTCIEVAKRNPNIYLEISNQYEIQILKKCLKEIEPSRILFGTTFPERLSISSINIFDIFNLKEEEKSAIFNDNAKKIIT